jgi:hypothetical protein
MAAYYVPYPCNPARPSRRTIMEPNGLAAIIMIVILVAVLGYFLNIYNLATTKTLTGMSLLRTIAIFIFPLGCVLGFISNAPEKTRELVLIKSEENSNDMV